LTAVKGGRRVPGYPWGLPRILPSLTQADT
jgi:hypothetical protein